MKIIQVDMGAIVQVCRVGAHFEALCKGVFVVLSDLRCLFFTSQGGPQEQCVLKLSVQTSRS